MEKGIRANQATLIITQKHEPEINRDDLQVAQFIYLLLNNQNIRNVMDNIAAKAALVLGKFTIERKQVLNSIHAELTQRNYLPILFGFSGLENLNI